MDPTLGQGLGSGNLSKGTENAFGIDRVCALRGQEADTLPL